MFAALCEKVDSRAVVDFCMDCHATAGAVSRNDGEWALSLESTFLLCGWFSMSAGFSLVARFSSSRILGVAVLLVGLFVDFRGELDSRSAVPLKQGIPLGVSRCFLENPQNHHYDYPKLNPSQKELNPHHYPH